MQPEPLSGKTRPSAPVEVQRHEGLASANADNWDALNRSGTPFLDYAFLAGLETQRLVGPGTGWRPCHFTATQSNRLLAAMPVYEKTDSFGEFVFDWAWAEAYHRTGNAYFPKLVAGVPFTPVPGDRILARNDDDLGQALPALLSHLNQCLEEDSFSSLHILFPTLAQVELLRAAGFLTRLDCRFLWRNAGYTTFDDFLGTFSARQRKNIRRERRKIREAGIRFTWVTGKDLDDLDWAQIHEICASTFYRRGQRPYLDRDFFALIARRMPDKILINLAYSPAGLIGASIFFRDSNTLYGRYWGSLQQVDCLHFEACYYQGIEYAIAHGLASFDPGTQGEHKLRRGFAPVASWSLHKFADQRLAAGIRRWLREEQRLVRKYILSCRAAMPFNEPASNQESPT